MQRRLLAVGVAGVVIALESQHSGGPDWDCCGPCVLFPRRRVRTTLTLADIHNDSLVDGDNYTDMRKTRLLVGSVVRGSSRRHGSCEQNCRVKILPPEPHLP